MRIFRRSKSRRIRDLEQRLCWADERNARLRQRLERTLNDYYVALKQSRHYKTELRHVNAHFNAFIWQQALKTQPKHKRIQGYVDDVTHLTAELVADITEEEN